MRALREKEGLKCPLCGSANVSGSAPLRVPFDWLRPAERFMPYTIKVECECYNCGNWWTQPLQLSLLIYGCYSSPSSFTHT